MNQSFHWSNIGVTLHPMVGYYKVNGELKHISYVALSECNIHDTVAVHLFISKFITTLKELLPNTKKIIYFSDGCAGKFGSKII